MSPARPLVALVGAGSETSNFPECAGITVAA